MGTAVFGEDDESDEEDGTISKILSTLSMIYGSNMQNIFFVIWIEYIIAS